MFKPTAKVIKRKDTTKEIFEAIEKLTKRDVLVGIPQSRSQRMFDDPLNNAELAALHTEGSPAQRIPARPFLQPSIIDDSKNIGYLQILVIKAALKGKNDLAVRNQEKLGQHVVIVAQNWFTDPKNNWAPNSPATIYKKSTKDKNGKIVKLSNRPLIDLEELRKSIHYVLRVDGEDLPNF